MNTNWKVLVVATSLSSAGILAAFLFGVDVLLAHSKDIAALEERIDAIEETSGLMRRSQEIDSMQILSLGLELEAFRHQVHALEFGTYVAEAYSSLDSGRGVCFEGSPYTLDTFRCSRFGARPGEVFKVILYSATGEAIDEFDVGSLVGPGDYVIAWYDTGEKISQLGLPLSPVYDWTPYYWNEQSGLAVAIGRFAGGVLRP